MNKIQQVMQQKCHIHNVRVSLDQHTSQGIQYRHVNEIG